MWSRGTGSIGTGSVANRTFNCTNSTFLLPQDGTKKLSFAIVGPTDLATVNKLLYATYHPYEPLTRHLGLCDGPNSLKDVDKMVQEIIVKNLTL